MARARDRHAGTQVVRQEGTGIRALGDGGCEDQHFNQDMDG